MIKLVYTVFKYSITGIGWLAAITLDEQTLVPIGSAVFVLLGCWHLSARFQRLEDGVKEIKRRLDRLEDH